MDSWFFYQCIHTGACYVVYDNWEGLDEGNYLVFLHFSLDLNCEIINYQLCLVHYSFSLGNVSYDLCFYNIQVVKMYCF